MRREFFEACDTECNQDDAPTPPRHCEVQVAMGFDENRFIGDGHQGAPHLLPPNHLDGVAVLGFDPHFPPFEVAQRHNPVWDWSITIIVKLDSVYDRLCDGIFPFEQQYSHAGLPSPV